MYQAITNNIVVTAIPEFLPHHSSEQEFRYVWAYHIEIINYGESPVRLLKRYWHITDANGRVQEVRGEGVVGEQPLILPQSSYSYASACPLITNSGIMRGSFEMVDDTGGHFLVEIPTFSLDLPIKKTVN